VIQVYIGERFFRDSLDIYIIRKFDGDPRYILRPEGDEFGRRWEPLPDGAAASDQEDKPSFCLPFEVGQSLLDALVRHYQGAEDTRALRRDYDAERKRVDEHTKTLSDIARLLARPPAL
jgi:hypothetical protein